MLWSSLPSSGGNGSTLQGCSLGWNRTGGPGPCHENARNPNQVTRAGSLSSPNTNLWVIGSVGTGLWFHFTFPTTFVEILIARSFIVFYLRGPQGQYIWECMYSWMPSARIRVNSHLQPYETSPSLAIQDISAPAISDISAPAIQHISAPAIQDTSPAETCICNNPPSFYTLWSK